MLFSEISLLNLIIFNVILSVAIFEIYCTELGSIVEKPSVSASRSQLM